MCCVTFVLCQHKIDISSMFWFCLESGPVDLLFRLEKCVNWIFSQTYNAEIVGFWSEMVPKLENFEFLLS